MALTGKRLIAGAALVAVGFVGGSMVSGALAQHTQQDEGSHEIPGMTQEQQEMMDAWMKANQLGPQHEMLAEKAGTWTVTMKHWMDPNQPNQPPQVSQATSTSKSIMDGRYVLDHFEGTTMGMPFSGMGLTGYDNINQKFKTVWIDNFSTGMFFMEGEGNDQGGMTLYGKMKDPMGDMQHMKAVSTKLGPDQERFEMFKKQPDGSWWKEMEMDYKRSN